MMRPYILTRNVYIFAKNCSRKSIRTLSIEVSSEYDVHHAKPTDIQNIEENCNSSGHTNCRSTRKIPLTSEEFEVRRNLIPVQPENPHLLKVAILGEPNVGKSTLINSLIRWKIFSVSKKVHTTRKNASGIFVEKNKQVVFLDTPGLVSLEHSKRHLLEASLVVDPKRSASAADLIAVVIDASNKWRNKAITDEVFDILDECKDKTSVLVLNKVDKVKKKKELLNMINVLTNAEEKEKKESEKEKLGVKKNVFEETESGVSGNRSDEIEKLYDYSPVEEEVVQKGWSNFSDVFIVSALNGLGISDLRKYMLLAAKPSPWIHHYASVTDQHPHSIAIQIIKGNLLNSLPEEIPYKLNLKINSWIVDAGGVLRLNISIVCQNNRHKSLIIGPSGTRISNCVQESRVALSNAFHCEVFLKLVLQ